MTSIATFFSVSRRRLVVAAHGDPPGPKAPEADAAAAEAASTVPPLVTSADTPALASSSSSSGGSGVARSRSALKRGRSSESPSPALAEREQQLPPRAKKRAAAAAAPADGPAIRSELPCAAEQGSPVAAGAVALSGDGSEDSAEDVAAAAPGAAVDPYCGSGDGGAEGRRAGAGMLHGEAAVVGLRSCDGGVCSTDGVDQREASASVARIDASVVAQGPVARRCIDISASADVVNDLPLAVAATGGVPDSSSTGDAHPGEPITSISYEDFLKSCAASAERPPSSSAACPTPVCASPPSSTAGPAHARVTVVVADVHRASDQPSPRRPAVATWRHGGSSGKLASAGDVALSPAFANCVSQAQLSIDVVQTDAAAHSSSQPKGRATTRSRRLRLHDAPVRDALDGAVVGAPAAAGGGGNGGTYNDAAPGATAAECAAGEGRGFADAVPAAAGSASGAASSARGDASSCHAALVVSVPAKVDPSTPDEMTSSSSSSRSVDPDVTDARSPDGSAALRSAAAGAGGSSEDCAVLRRPRRGAATRAIDAIMCGLAEESGRRTAGACSQRRAHAEDASARPPSVKSVHGNRMKGATTVSHPVAPPDGLRITGSDDLTKLAPIFRRNLGVPSRATSAAASSAKPQSVWPATADRIDLTSSESSPAQQLDPDRVTRKAVAGTGGSGLELYPNEPWQVVHVQQLPCKEEEEEQQQQARRSVLGPLKFKLRRSDASSCGEPASAAPMPSTRTRVKDLLEHERHHVTPVRLTKMLDQTPAFSLSTVRELLKDIASKTPGRAVNRSFKRLCARSGKPLPADDVSKDGPTEGIGSATDSTLQPSTAAAAAAPDAAPSGTKDSYKGDDVWIEKYRPLKSDELLANSGAVGELRQWLLDWHAVMSRESCGVAAEPEGAAASKGRQQRKQMRRSPDDSDSDSRDSVDAGPCNMALVTGPPGCGKTAAVYALANELGFKVFELNPSSARTYKHILDQLQEVTQSHHFDSSTLPASGFPSDAELPAFTQRTTPSVPAAAASKQAPANSILNFFSGRSKGKQGSGKPANGDVGTCPSSDKDVSLGSSAANAAAHKLGPPSDVAQSGTRTLRARMADTPITSAARSRPRNRAATNDDSSSGEPVQEPVASVGSHVTSCGAGEPVPAKRAVKRRHTSESGSGASVLCVDGPATTAASCAAAAAVSAAQQPTNSTSGARSRGKDGGEPQRQQASSSSSSNLTSFSLVLFEEADVIFEEDRGFWAAVQALLRDTKKPIVLTAAAAVPASLQGLQYSYRHIKMECPPACHLAAYLSEICVAENTSVDFEHLLRLVHSCQADVRRTMLQLQCLVQTGSLGCRHRVSCSGAMQPDSVGESAAAAAATGSSAVSHARPLEHLLYATEDPALLLPAAHMQSYRPHNAVAADVAALPQQLQQQRRCPSGAADSRWSSLLSELALLEPALSDGSGYSSRGDGEPRSSRVLPCRGSQLLPGLADKAAPPVADGQALCGRSSSGSGDALEDELWRCAVRLSHGTAGHVDCALDERVPASAGRAGLGRAGWLDLGSSGGGVHKKPCYNLCERPHCDSSYAPVTVEEAAVAAAAEHIIGYGAVGQTKAAIGCDYLPAIRSICAAEAARKRGAVAAAAAEGGRRRESVKRRFHHHLFELPEDVQHALSVAGLGGSSASIVTVPTT